MPFLLLSITIMVMVITIMVIMVVIIFQIRPLSISAVSCILPAWVDFTKLNPSKVTENTCFSRRFDFLTKHFLKKKILLRRL